MTIETITKRIEGKEKEIAKLEKRMSRILADQATGFQGDYCERDLKWTTRDLEKAKELLEEYKAKLEEETKKENSRNVTVIIEFLNNWKEESFKFYHEMLPKFLEAREAFYAEDKRVREELKGQPFNVRYRATENVKKDFRAKWGWIEGFVYREQINDEELKKTLDREADRKYDFIIERTKEIVDEITSADRLHIEKGELNGFIEGTKGTARVTTIGAGGYNIQRYHFRTLVKRA